MYILHSKFRSSNYLLAYYINSLRTAILSFVFLWVQTQGLIPFSQLGIWHIAAQTWPFFRLENWKIGRRWTVKGLIFDKDGLRIVICQLSDWATSSVSLRRTTFYSEYSHSIYKLIFKNGTALLMKIQEWQHHRATALFFVQISIRDLVLKPPWSSDLPFSSLLQSSCLGVVQHVLIFLRVILHVQLALFPAALANLLSGILKLLIWSY